MNVAFAFLGKLVSIVAYRLLGKVVLKQVPDGNVFICPICLLIVCFVFSCPGSSIPDRGQWLSDRNFRILTQGVTFDT